MLITDKQKLQRDRAYFKFCLSGLYKPVNIYSLTPYEQIMWGMILGHKDKLIEQFDKHSVEMGLNVPKYKCWCGKEAKYHDEHGDLVCKKHLEE